MHVAVNVIGSLEQQGLSGVTVTVSLPDSSGVDCVDEYFAVLNGYRTNNTSTRIGPFLMNLCATPNISGVIVGTIRNGVDGPTTTASSLQANTRGKVLEYALQIHPLATPLPLTQICTPA